MKGIIGIAKKRDRFGFGHIEDSPAIHWLWERGPVSDFRRGIDRGIERLELPSWSEDDRDGSTRIDRYAVDALLIRHSTRRISPFDERGKKRRIGVDSEKRSGVGQDFRGSGA